VKYRRGHRGVIDPTMGPNVSIMLNGRVATMHSFYCYRSTLHRFRSCCVHQQFLFFTTSPPPSNFSTLDTWTTHPAAVSTVHPSETADKSASAGVSDVPVSASAVDDQSNLCFPGKGPLETAKVQDGADKLDGDLNPEDSSPLGEYGYRFKGPEPTRFGDWSHNCRCTDF